MQKWSKRKQVVVGLVVGIVFVMMLMGNVAQYLQNARLKEQVRNSGEEWQDIWCKYQDLLGDYEDLEQALKVTESDLEFEKMLHQIAEEDFQKIATWTLEEAKEQAKEDGFDPEAVDWFLNGEGHWCFWFYD